LTERNLGHSDVIGGSVEYSFMMIPLSRTALSVLKERYLLRDENGDIVETPEDMFRRVAGAVALADEFYGEDVRKAEETFYSMMSRLEFLPNSPTLMNAGTSINQLSACFVLPVPDSIEGIFDSLRDMAIIHRPGGGVGFSFSDLRPEGDVVASTMGVASGPVSFMRIFDVAVDVIKQGGRRRGANMGVLRVNHPDILGFIDAKTSEGPLSNFNLSVSVPDSFMERPGRVDLINPRTGETVDSLSSGTILRAMVKAAWRCGDPGVIFEDRINRYNPTPSLGRIEATNPCVTAETMVLTGEGPLRVAELIGRPFLAEVNGYLYPCSSGFFKTGVQDVYELRTREGCSLRLTDDHRILVMDDGPVWRAAGDLERGDLLVMNSRAAGWGLWNHERRDEVNSFNAAGNSGHYKPINDKQELVEATRTTLPVVNHKPINDKQEPATHESEGSIGNILLDEDPGSGEMMVLSTFSGLKSRGVEEVYDASVLGINAFAANGFLVHNCGEQPLLPYESCNLGSINLGLMAGPGGVKWDRLAKTVHRAVHFLDNVIDVNSYPLRRIQRTTRRTRKIGLGVMGFADMLIRLGVPYSSDAALRVARRVMAFIEREARSASMKLAVKRGSFPAFSGSRWDLEGFECMRNATLTTIAPTGSLSIIAGVSSGIEPLFAVSFKRNIMGRVFHEINPLLREAALREGLDTGTLKKIVSKGTLRDMPGVPESMRRLFVTAHEIDPVFHVKMQAAFQRHVDNAVSKTVNLPENATPSDVERVFMAAYRLGCKGVTVYRYGSKRKEVLQFPEYAGSCRDMTCPN